MATTVSIALLLMLAPQVQTAFAAAPIVQQVTGGGWILYTPCGGEESKRAFGFNAKQLEDGTLRGNVQYVDHGTGYPHVYGYEITGLTITGNQAQIWGIWRLNGDKTPRGFYVKVIDVDEPGKHDWFEISIPSIGYWAGAELGFPGDAGGGGNIQVHRPAL